MLKFIQEIKGNKDLDKPIVSVKGWRHRVIHAKLPAAEGAPLVRIALDQIETHAFLVHEGRPTVGEDPQQTFDLHCSALAFKRGHGQVDLLVGTFKSQQRAEQAKDALEKALTSSKKMWIVGGVGVLLYAVLFMPLPNSNSAQRQAYQAPTQFPQGMQRAPMGSVTGPLTGSPTGLPIPSIGNMPMPGLPPAVAPIGAANEATPSASQAAPAPSLSMAPPKPTPAPGAESDPFGLQIGPTGTTGVGQGK